MTDTQTGIQQVFQARDRAIHASPPDRAEALEEFKRAADAAIEDDVMVEFVRELKRDTIEKVTSISS